MNINATLFLQAVVFAILVWFTMKFVWPPIAKALDERAAKIADGLAAADKAKSELATANKRVDEQLAQTRTETTKLLGDAEKRAAALIEDATAAPIAAPEAAFRSLSDGITRLLPGASNEAARPLVVAALGNSISTPTQGLEAEVAAALEDADVQL